MSESNQELIVAPQLKIDGMSTAHRVALLRCFIWLDGHGESTTDSRDFIASFAEAMGLDMAAIQRAYLEAAQATNASEVVQGFGDEIDKTGILAMLVALAIAGERYDARQRAALRRMARSLDISEAMLDELERSAYQLREQNIALSEHLSLENLEEEARGSAGDKKSDNAKWIIAGAVAGAVALGATGFVAAPAIGGIVGAKALGLSGAAATSAGTAFFGGGAIASGGLGIAGGKAVIAGACSLGGGILGGRSMARRTGDLQEFDIENLKESGSRVVLGVSGFLSEDRDFSDHWRGLREFYGHQSINALRWESKCLKDLALLATSIGANAVTHFGAKQAAAQAAKAFAGSAALPLWAASALKVIDNPWSVARDRAEKAGRRLADALRQEPWGRRPITLVGFSLGTRVIVHALNELDCPEIAGRIEAVYLLGGAVDATCDTIDRIGQAVDGPVINGYCRSDWTLKLLYGLAERKKAIGLGPLRRDHILDVDLSDIVRGHHDYNGKLPQVLERVTTAAQQENPEYWV